MTRTVERVARAIASAFHDGDWDAVPHDSDDGTMCRLDYLLMARAAIAALHDTTVISAALRLAVEAEKVCGTFAGDRSVDGLRAALSAFADAYYPRPPR